MSLLTNTATEGTYPFEVILSEGESIAREKVTLVSGQNLKAGAVLGQITGGTTSVGSVTFAGTGNGTCTKASPAYSAAALNGSYTAVCLEKTTDLGTFEVLRPDGTVDGIATVGVAYDGQVKFTIADGLTDFASGDTFTIPVTASGSGKYAAHDNSATNGTAVAAAVLLADCDASGGDATALVLARLAEVNGALLTWKSGISSPNKAAGIVQLASKYLIVR